MEKKLDELLKKYGIKDYAPKIEVTTNYKKNKRNKQLMGKKCSKSHVGDGETRA
jgi:hypothetical protein